MNVDDEITKIVRGDKTMVASIPSPVMYNIGKIEKDVNKIKKENKELKRRLDFCYQQIESILKLIDSNQ